MSYGFSNLDSATDDIANPKKLMAGRIDLWISTTVQSGPTCRMAGNDPDSIEPALALTDQKMFLAFSLKTDDSIVARWQAALDNMVHDGTREKILKKWHLTPLFSNIGV